MRSENIQTIIIKTYEYYIKSLRVQTLIQMFTLFMLCIYMIAPNLQIVNDIVLPGKINTKKHTQKNI